MYAEFVENSPSFETFIAKTMSIEQSIIMGEF